MSRLLSQYPVALCALLVLSACSDIAGLARAEEGAPCASDGECATNIVCVIGVCVDPSAQALDEVLLEVRPPESSGYRPQQLPDPISIGGEGRTSVQLKPTVLLRGNVTDTMGMGLPAQVIAVPETGIVGRALVVTAQAAGSGGDFTLPVVEGDTYRIVVQPQDATRPPFSMESAQSIGPTPAGERRLAAITLPDPAALPSVAGRVVAGEGSAMLGVEGLEVRVLAGSRRVSSIARTLADGSFTVFVAAGADQEDGLVLEIRPTESNRLNPTVVQEDLVLGEGNTDLGDIALGALAAPVPFAGVVAGPDGDPVPLATVYLTAELGTGTFSLVLAADEDGRYDSELRPGTYEVAVVAPADSAAGMVAGFEAIVDAETSPTLNLPGRVVASGTVIDDGGSPVPNAQVTFTRLGGVGGGTEGVLDGVTWSFTAITDPQGLWQRGVDPGRYRASIHPDQAANLPRDTFVVDIEEGTEALGELVLPGAALIAGTIVSVDGLPLGMTIVTAFPTFALAAGDDALELGSSLTGNDGAFEILLPDLVP